MYKKNKYIVFALLFAAVVASSCSDWLEMHPQDKIVREDFWKSKEDVLSAVIGCYSSLEETDNVARFFMWGELRGPYVIPGARAYKATETLKPNDLMNGNIQPDNEVFTWASIYKTINFCNTVLELAPSVINVDQTFTEDELNYYKAEVLTIRSLMYFLLVRSFKDVPLVLNATLNDEKSFDIAKTKEEVILDTIINDLNFAIQYSRESYGNTPAELKFNKGRVTRFAVCALLADVYLWKNQYQNCINMCDIIINSKNYQLEPTVSWFANTFANGDLNSSEIIWQLPFKVNGSGQGAPFYNWFIDNKDKFYLWNSEAIDVWESDTTAYRTPKATIKSKVPYDLVDKYVRKADNSARGSGDYATWIYYRYSDVLLMKAEALIETNTPENINFALDSLVASVHYREYKRPNASYFNVDRGDLANMQQFILDERTRELVFEGKHWFDVLRFTRRTNSLNFLRNMITVKFGVGTLGSQVLSKYSDPNSLYNPIYFKEMDNNKLLEQNPYYLTY